MSVNNPLSEVESAIRAGDKERARQLLRPILTSNPSADAWFLASKVATSQSQALGFLKRAQELDPFHEPSAQAIEQLTAPTTPPPPTQQVSVPSSRPLHEEEETTYYSDSQVTITNKRAIFTGKITYAMALVTSVAFAEIPHHRGWAIGVALLGVLFLVISGNSENASSPSVLVCSVFMVIIGAVWAIAERPKYAVRLGSASGEADVLVSKDREYIEKIVTAVHTAIVERS